MFWVYFVRDYYRASAPQNAQRATQSAPSSFQSLPNPTITTHTAAVVYDAEAVAAATPPQALATQPAASPIHTYLQRLSVEGEHAFGVWDEDAGFSVFSANFERITGLSSGDCAGHDWIHAVHHHQQYAINESLLAATQGQNGRCLVQVRDHHDEDVWRWMLIDIKAATARQPGIMVLWRDMTDQKALEEALQETKSALALSDRGRSAFLASMSHELRTPLNAIMGFSEMMNAKVFGPLGNDTYAEYAQHIHDSGSALLSKINDLLEIASMDSGGLVIEEGVLSLNALLGEVVEMHSHTAFTRQQTLKLDCPLSIELRADRAKLICAASHLLSNALRHSANGGDITLSVRIQADDGVIISVRDAGEGITPAQLSNIRAAMVVTDTYYNIECGGIGLGLSLAKELTQRHGGRMMIDSIRHRGTVVSMILPIDRVISGLPKKKKPKLELAQ